jgi:hypothetical protein
MARFNVSPADVAQGKLCQKPGWKLLEIVKYAEEPNKAKDATNYVFDFQVREEGVDNNITIRVWFSEKAPGFAVQFLKALGAEEKPDGSMSVDFTSALVGRRINGFISRGEYKGKPTNQIDDYSVVS